MTPICTKINRLPVPLMRKLHTKFPLDLAEHSGLIVFTSQNTSKPKGLVIPWLFIGNFWPQKMKEGSLTLLHTDSDMGGSCTKLQHYETNHSSRDSDCRWPLTWPRNNTIHIDIWAPSIKNSWYTSQNSYFCSKWPTVNISNNMAPVLNIRKLQTEF